MEKDPTGAIYIHLDDEVSKIISQHKIDLGGAVKAELSQQGFSVRTKLLPTQPRPNRTVVCAGYSSVRSGIFSGLSGSKSDRCSQPQ